MKDYLKRCLSCIYLKKDTDCWRCSQNPEYIITFDRQIVVVPFGCKYYVSKLEVWK